MDKVSVILPIYNVSQYLRQALDSVINQTLRELEIICVDDGSTDDSLEIIREYARKDPRIVVITGPNGGYGKAMNKGLDRATGEYIGIVEPDDYVDLHMFEDLYRIAAENRLDLVKADFYRFTQEEDGTEQLQYVYLDGTQTRYGELLNPSQDPSCIRFTLNTWAGIYRRAFLEEHAIRHNETPGASFQDNGFYFQTFVYAQRAMIVNKPYYHNRRDNPNSSVKSREKVYCMNIEYDYIRDLLMKDPALWERFQYMYWWKKYHNYWFTYNRIDDSYKPEYMQRMRQEYRRAMELGQLSQEVFTAREWADIQKMIFGPSELADKLRGNAFVRKLLPFVPRIFKRMALKIITYLVKVKNKVKQLICR